MNVLKIGIFTDSYPPSLDGVATSVYASARELKKRGHDVYIIAPAQPHRTDFKHVYRILSVQLYKEPPIRWGVEIPQLSTVQVSLLDFDLIHGHSGGPISLMGWQIAQIRDIPFIETYHTMWRHYRHYFPVPVLWKPWVLNKLCGYFGNHCDALVAPSEKVKKELELIGVKKPVYVVPSGIDLEEYQEERTENFLHKLLGLEAQIKILLSVGRFEREKNDDFLIKSFALVVKTHPKTVLVLIGQGRDEEKLKALTYMLEISDSVFFLSTGIGHGDMPKVYRDSYLFLFSSKTETQGLAIVEALATGVPVVALKDKAFEGTLFDGQNCLLSEENERLFAKKVSHLLENTHLHQKLSNNAEKMVQNFSAENTASKLESVYEDVLLRHKMTVENLWEKFIKAVI